MAVNSGTSSRTGTITIGGQTFSVTQAGAGNNILVGSSGTYSTIQLGYNNALTGSTIQVQTAAYPEIDIFNSNVSVTLSGGYGSSFSTSN